MASVRRASRFLIDVPVRWRPRGDDGWFAGATVNISRSGVLIETDRRLAPGAMIEIVVALSRLDTPHYQVSDVICAGRVVRSERIGAGRRRCRIAATIDAYSLVRRMD